MNASRPPRVLMVVPQYPYPIVGGLEKQSHELAKALVGLGIEVNVLSGKILRDHPASEVVEGVPVFRLPWSTRRAARFARSPFDVALAMCRLRNRFDVVHLHQHSWVGLYVIILAKLLGKPVLTKLPNVGDYGIPGLRRQFLGWLRLRILLASDALVAMSKQSLRELREVGYPAGRVLAVTNGITMRPLASRAPASGPVRVVFVGRLNPQKGLDVLLRAWKVSRNSRQLPAVLELWGTGFLAEELTSLAEELGVRDSVVFAGQVEGVPGRLPEADVFVLPSRAEGNSNAILEAMAAGLPIVATPVGGTAMQVGEEGAPLLCPVEDIGALASRLSHLIGDAGLRGELGGAMRRRAEEFFDIVAVAHRYRDAYALLAGKRRDGVSLVSSPLLVSSDGESS